MLGFGCAIFTALAVAPRPSSGQSDNTPKKDPALVNDTNPNPTTGRTINDDQAYQKAYNKAYNDAQGKQQDQGAGQSSGGGCCSGGSGGG